MTRICKEDYFPMLPEHTHPGCKPCYTICQGPSYSQTCKEKCPGFSNKLQTTAGYEIISSPQTELTGDSAMIITVICMALLVVICVLALIMFACRRNWISCPTRQAQRSRTTRENVESGLEMNGHLLPNGIPNTVNSSPPIALEEETSLTDMGLDGAPGCSRDPVVLDEETLIVHSDSSTKSIERAPVSSTATNDNSGNIFAGYQPNPPMDGNNQNPDLVEVPSIKLPTQVVEDIVPTEYAFSGLSVNAD